LLRRLLGGHVELVTTRALRDVERPSALQLGQRRGGILRRHRAEVGLGRHHDRGGAPADRDDRQRQYPRFQRRPHRWIPKTSRPSKRSWSARFCANPSVAPSGAPICGISVAVIQKRGAVHDTTGPAKIVDNTATSSGFHSIWFKSR